MNKPFCTVVMLLALSAWNQAQSPGSKPLTEADLALPLSESKSGDPVLRQTESSVDLSLPSMRPAGKKPPATEAEATPKKKGNGTTEITAREGLFDQKAHQAIFITDVVVVNPEFHLTCDKLTAYLKDEGHPKTKPDANAAPAGETPAGGTPVKATKDKDAKGGGLERAIAEGTVVITQEKAEANGSVTRNVGKSKKAVYESGSGDMTLTGKPEVQTGINSCVALAEETVMVLNRDGRMKVYGPHKTIIKDASTPETPRSGR